MNGHVWHLQATIAVPLRKNNLDYYTEDEHIEHAKQSVGARTKFYETKFIVTEGRKIEIGAPYNSHIIVEVWTAAPLKADVS